MDGTSPVSPRNDLARNGPEIGADATAMKTLYLHIGLPKTGSTWLQEQVLPCFPHLSGVASPTSRYFGMPEDRATGNRVLSDTFRRAPELWDAVGDDLFAHILALSDAPPGEGRDVLFSEEGMGRQASRPAHLVAHLRALAATAARAGFGRTRVLAFIRRQDTWLASHYAQVSGLNPAAGQADFERLVADVAEPRRARYGFGTLLDWAALQDALHAAVGPENVRLVPQERLAGDPRGVLEDLAHWTGAGREVDPVLDGAVGGRANVRSAGTYWNLRDRPRKLGPLRLSGRLRRRGGQICLTPALSETIVSAYREGNLRLDRDGLDLARYGYCP